MFLDESIQNVLALSCTANDVTYVCKLVSNINDNSTAEPFDTGKPAVSTVRVKKIIEAISCMYDSNCRILYTKKKVLIFHKYVI